MRFSEASAVSPSGQGTWKAEVQPGWDIFGIADGGYLMAIAARAMAEQAGGRLPVTVTGHFLRPVSAGPVEVTVETIKEGRTFSTMAARLAAASESVTLLGSVAEPGFGGHDEPYIAATPPDLPPPEECVLNVPAVDGPLPPPLMAQFEQRIHPDDAQLLEGGPSGKALIRGWLRLHDHEPLDAFALLLIADSFPPAVFNANLPLAWTPTLEMTTQIRGMPEGEWLRCQFSTRFVTGGLLEEDGEIWDEAGNLVALARQLALVPR